MKDLKNIVKYAFPNLSVLDKLLKIIEYPIQKEKQEERDFIFPTEKTWKDYLATKSE